MVLRMRFVLSADRLEGLPDSPAELAVVGRSNVGKSSLVNALSGTKAMAKTSKTPGRTQLLNLFELLDPQLKARRHAQTASLLD